MLRAHPLCAWQCGRLATIDDHVVAIAEGGDPDDPSNRQGLCESCHEIKSADEARRARDRQHLPDLDRRPSDH